MKSWLIHLKGNRFIIALSVRGKKALKDIKQNEYRCSSSAKSAVFAHSVSSSNRKRCLGAVKDILVLTAFRPCKQKSISLFLHMMDDLTIRACLWIPTRELTCHHLSFILMIKAPRNRLNWWRSKHVNLSLPGVQFLNQWADFPRLEKQNKGRKMWKENNRSFKSDKWMKMCSTRLY